MAIVRRRGLQTEQFARRRRKKLIFAVILFLIAIASIASTLLLFFRAGFVQIQSVEVSGPVGVNGGVLSLVPAAAVQSDIEKDLVGSWYYLFSKNTLFFYPKSAIRAELLKEYPAIASVDFEPQGAFLGFGNDIILRVLITERTPFALACDAAAGAAGTDKDCFYMDDSGFVYAPAADISPGMYVDYESSSVPLSAGKPIADQTSFDTAKQIVGFVSGMGLDVSEDTIGSDAFGSTDTLIVDDGLSADTSSSSSASTTLTTEIYFNQSEPVGTGLRYFSEFWQNEATSSDTVFQYIDMRYGKDIVYKLYPQNPQSDTKDAKTNE